MSDNATRQANRTGPSSTLLFAQVQIPLYSVILFLAIVGNVLVILTLVQNKRMRTVTNVHLINLAVGDLLLGVFCMPFTLVGMLLRDFIFGAIMCKLIPYLQAVSVAVSAWTLVAISVERYYAICHPFMSRRWQTLSHARRIIVVIWAASLVCMLPIALLSLLRPLGDTGRSKCREVWPNDFSEKAFNIFLDAILLIIPLLIMVITYSLITATLWKGIRKEKRHDYDDGGDDTTKSTSSSNETLEAGGSTTSWEKTQVRRNNVQASLANKKRVIKMLFVVVLEFFVCWTPLYVVNTLSLFSPKVVYHDLGYLAISFLQLIAYASSCCNPVTYCFMNSKFKRSFLAAFRCATVSLPTHKSSASTCADDHTK